METLDDDQKRLLARALTRSAVDSEYRKRLLATPHAAITEATGLELPPQLRIQFIETPRNVDALIVLPPVVEDPAG